MIEKRKEGSKRQEQKEDDLVDFEYGYWILDDWILDSIYRR